ncbi:hypothetical protein PMM47T1_16605 [Pseudomonas sp. M47T1]|uniref:type VI secretion system protein TssA n=1 Tax=Pseudomonas sp. M47T1 TaxID=1179778 RepID=UPI000260885F|nr:type VI secretion system protein TssA [Pseudomonas sp. M47T1]EIK95428.1 hypothetical protein PMM47T1_16605 [Pseudomonas sp. M47T1]
MTPAVAVDVPVVDDALLAPLPGAQPCGPSLRYDLDYDRLRELRRADDDSLPTGVWQHTSKQADWAAVESLASQLLSLRSKDLMIAAWLGEAWLHRQGLAGLEAALVLIVGLCERYPDELHPQAQEGDQSWRVTPLDWLVRRYAEVVLVNLPLFDEPQAPTLYAWQQLQQQQVQANDSKAAKVRAEEAVLQRKKWLERLRAVPVGQWRAGLEHVHRSQVSLAQLEQWGDTWLGLLAPTVAPLREVTKAYAALLKEFTAMHPSATVDSVVETALAVTPTAPEPQPTIPAGVPANREDAYRQLTLIADFLARTEPHSPVPYLIKRAVEWGHKPLNELLSELISADAEARRVWTLMGVL